MDLVLIFSLYYWITLTPEKSKEINEKFKNIRNEKEYLNIVKNQLMELPNVKSVSFIGNHVINDNITNNSMQVLAYDDIMMDMIDVLILKGKPINSKNINEVLINEELSNT